MSLLRTIFWVVLAVALALFAKANWVVAPSYTGYVPVKLWGDFVLETRLPVLIIAAFLLGLVPMWLWSRATKWQMRRKLSSAERALASNIATQQNSTPEPKEQRPLPVGPADPEAS